MGMCVCVCVLYVRAETARKLLSVSLSLASVCHFKSSSFSSCHYVLLFLFFMYQLFFPYSVIFCGAVGVTIQIVPNIIT